MSLLTMSTDRRIEGGDERFLPLAINETPFQGSYLCINVAGYTQRFGSTATGVASTQRFAGVARRTIQAKDAPSANGQVSVQAATGRLTIVAAIAGLTQTDILNHRRVYATNDNDLTLTAEAGSMFIGTISDAFTQFGAGIPNGVVIECETFQEQNLGEIADLGSIVLADAAATLITAQLDYLLELPNTATRVLTLPPVATCTGRRFRIKKTTSAAFAFTLQANAAETVEFNNTYTSSTTQGAYAEIRSDGTQWLLECKI